MSRIVVTGTGTVRISRNYPKSISDLAAEAAREALKEAGVDRVDYVVASTAASYLQHPQLDFSAYITNSIGLQGVRAISVEAGESSGLAALEIAFSLLKSGAAESVLLVGADKLTEHTSGPTYRMLQALYDVEGEGFYKIGHAAVPALLMRLYMEKYSVDRLTMSYWPAMMHAHAKANPHAMLRFAIDPAAVEKAIPVADPITLLDAYPLGDGAAAVVLEPEDTADSALARIEEVHAATGLPSPAMRDDPLELESVRALSQKLGEKLSSIDVIEIHDSFTIMGLLELEALGFAERGRAAHLVRDGYFDVEDKGPLVNPSGGLKARGHPIGATDVYKIAEISRVLAGKWPGVMRGDEKRGAVLSLNGAGSSARIALFSRI